MVIKSQQAMWAYAAVLSLHDHVRKTLYRPIKGLLMKDSRLIPTRTLSRKLEQAKKASVIGSMHDQAGRQSDL